MQIPVVLDAGLPPPLLEAAVSYMQLLPGCWPTQTWKTGASSAFEKHPRYPDWLCMEHWDQVVVPGALHSRQNFSSLLASLRIMLQHVRLSLTYSQASHALLLAQEAWQVEQPFTLRTACKRISTARAMM